MPAPRAGAIDLYDPEILSKKAQLEAREKIKASGIPRPQMRADAPIFKMFEEIAAREANEFRQRDEERRRRDPTFSPTALDFTDEPIRAFGAC